jgi:hypothetical protein
VSTAQVRKIKCPARELTDVDVQFLSIVKRGANRTPFKILKREDQTMSIDLGKLFFRKTEPSKPPVVVAVMLEKGEDAELWKKIFADAGFEFPVTEVDETSGVTVLKGEEVPSDVVTLGLSDTVAVAVGNVQKGIDPYPGGLSFSENVVKSGFFPGFVLAQEALAQTLYMISSTPGNQDETVSLVQKALDDFSSYIMTLVMRLPRSVFKMEQVVKTGVAGMKVAEPVVEVSKDEALAAVVIQKEEGSVEEASEAGSPGVETGVEPGAADSIAVLTESVTKLEGFIRDMQASVVKLAEAQGTTSATLGLLKAEMDRKIGEVEEVARKAEVAVGGIVASELTLPDVSKNMGNTRQKAEVGLFDSALHFSGFESRRG